LLEEYYGRSLPGESNLSDLLNRKEVPGRTLILLLEIPVLAFWYNEIDEERPS